MSNPKTDDEALLARVAQEAPEVLEADGDTTTIDVLIERLTKAPPAPKQKKNRGKRGITKSRGRQK